MNALADAVDGEVPIGVVGVDMLPPELSVYKRVAMRRASVTPVIVVYRNYQDLTTDEVLYHSGDGMRLKRLGNMPESHSGQSSQDRRIVVRSATAEDQDCDGSDGYSLCWSSQIEDLARFVFHSRLGMLEQWTKKKDSWYAKARVPTVFLLLKGEKMSKSSSYDPVAYLAPENAQAMRIVLSIASQEEMEFSMTSCYLRKKQDAEKGGDMHQVLMKVLGLVEDDLPTTVLRRPVVDLQGSHSPTGRVFDVDQDATSFEYAVVQRRSHLSADTLWKNLDDAISNRLAESYIRFDPVADTEEKKMSLKEKELRKVDVDSQDQNPLGKNKNVGKHRDTRARKARALTMNSFGVLSDLRVMFRKKEEGSQNTGDNSVMDLIGSWFGAEEVQTTPLGESESEAMKYAGVHGADPWMIDPSSPEFNAIRVLHSNRLTGQEEAHHLNARMVVNAAKRTLFTQNQRKDYGLSTSRSLPKWMRGDPRIVHEAVIKQAVYTLSDMHKKGLLKHAYLRIAKEMADWGAKLHGGKFRETEEMYEELSSAKSLVNASEIAGMMLYSLCKKQIDAHAQADNTRTQRVKNYVSGENVQHTDSNVLNVITTLQGDHNAFACDTLFYSLDSLGHIESERGIEQQINVYMISDKRRLTSLDDARRIMMDDPEGLQEILVSMITTLPDNHSRQNEFNTKLQKLVRSQLLRDIIGSGIATNGWEFGWKFGARDAIVRPRRVKHEGKQHGSSEAQASKSLNEQRSSSVSLSKPLEELHFSIDQQFVYLSTALYELEQTQLNTISLSRKVLEDHGNALLKFESRVSRLYAEIVYISGSSAPKHPSFSCAVPGGESDFSVASSGLHLHYLLWLECFKMREEYILLAEGIAPPLSPSIRYTDATLHTLLEVLQDLRTDIRSMIEARAIDSTSDNIALQQTMKDFNFTKNLHWNRTTALHPTREIRMAYFRSNGEFVGTISNITVFANGTIGDLIAVLVSSQELHQLDDRFRFNNVCDTKSKVCHVRLMEVRSHAIARIFDPNEPLSNIPRIYDTHRYVHKMAMLRAEAYFDEDSVMDQWFEGSLIFGDPSRFNRLKAEGARLSAERAVFSVMHFSPSRGHAFGDPLLLVINKQDTVNLVMQKLKQKFSPYSSLSHLLNGGSSGSDVSWYFRQWSYSSSGENSEQYRWNDCNLVLLKCNPEFSNYSQSELSYLLLNDDDVVYEKATEFQNANSSRHVHKKNTYHFAWLGLVHDRRAEADFVFQEFLLDPDIMHETNALFEHQDLTNSHRDTLTDSEKENGNNERTMPKIARDSKQKESQKPKPKPNFNGIKSRSLEALLLKERLHQTDQLQFTDKDEAPPLADDITLMDAYLAALVPSYKTDIDEAVKEFMNLNRADLLGIGNGRFSQSELVNVWKQRIDDLLGGRQQEYNPSIFEQSTRYATRKNYDETSIDEAALRWLVENVYQNDAVESLIRLDNDATLDFVQQNELINEGYSLSVNEESSPWQDAFQMDSIASINAGEKEEDTESMLRHLFGPGSNFQKHLKKRSADENKRFGGNRLQLEYMAFDHANPYDRMQNLQNKIAVEITFMLAVFLTLAGLVNCAHRGCQILVGKNGAGTVRKRHIVGGFSNMTAKSHSACSTTSHNMHHHGSSGKGRHRNEEGGRMNIEIRVRRMSKLEVAAELGEAFMQPGVKLAKWEWSIAVWLGNSICIIFIGAIRKFRKCKEGTAKERALKTTAMLLERETKSRKFNKENSQKPKRKPKKNKDVVTVRKKTSLQVESGNKRFLEKGPRSAQQENQQKQFKLRKQEKQRQQQQQQQKPQQQQTQKQQKQKQQQQTEKQKRHTQKNNQLENKQTEKQKQLKSQLSATESVKPEIGIGTTNARKTTLNEATNENIDVAKSDAVKLMQPKIGKSEQLSTIRESEVPQRDDMSYENLQPKQDEDDEQQEYLQFDRKRDQSNKSQQNNLGKAKLFSKPVKVDRMKTEIENKSSDSKDLQFENKRLVVLQKEGPQQQTEASTGKSKRQEQTDQRDSMNTEMNKHVKQHLNQQKQHNMIEEQKKEMELALISQRKEEERQHRIKMQQQEALLLQGQQQLLQLQQQLEESRRQADILKWQEQQWHQRQMNRQPSLQTQPSQQHLPPSLPVGLFDDPVIQNNSQMHPHEQFDSQQDRNRKLQASHGSQRLSNVNTNSVNWLPPPGTAAPFQGGGAMHMGASAGVNTTLWSTQISKRHSDAEYMSRPLNASMDLDREMNNIDDLLRFSWRSEGDSGVRDKESAGRGASEAKMARTSVELGSFSQSSHSAPDNGSRKW